VVVVEVLVELLVPFSVCLFCQLLAVFGARFSFSSLALPFSFGGFLVFRHVHVGVDRLDEVAGGNAVGFEHHASSSRAREAPEVSAFGLERQTEVADPVLVRQLVQSVAALVHGHRASCAEDDAVLLVSVASVADLADVQLVRDDLRVRSFELLQEPVRRLGPLTRLCSFFEARVFQSLDELLLSLANRMQVAGDLVCGAFGLGQLLF